MHFGLTWCSLMQLGAVWSRLVQLGAVWCTLVQVITDLVVAYLELKKLKDGAFTRVN